MSALAPGVIPAGLGARIGRGERAPASRRTIASASSAGSSATIETPSLSLSTGRRYTGVFVCTPRRGGTTAMVSAPARRRASLFHRGRQGPVASAADADVEVSALNPKPYTPSPAP
jgi:hypothetical protein